MPNLKQVTEIETRGVFLLAFSGAARNLGLLGDTEVEELLFGVSPDAWYPMERFRRVLDAVSQRCADFDPAMERMGEEMMRVWYTQGPGRSIVKRGVDFLTYQTGSGGYRRVVRGPEALTGTFTLESLDESAGRARILSSTPFDRGMERGVLLGGMRVSGDLAQIRVENSPDPSVFEIQFS